MRAHGLPPFIDGSCRREPDLEAAFPAISALCRLSRFVPRLQVGDRVAYMTCKGRVDSERPSSRYLVAILDVLERFESHPSAARWYRNRGSPLPSNCIVDGNAPVPYDLTLGIRSVDRERFEAHLGEATVLRHWDEAYAERAQTCGVMVACSPVWRSLQSPPELTEGTLVTIFGRVPGTQTPPRIEQDEMAALLAVARGQAPGAHRVVGGAG